MSCFGNYNSSRQCASCKVTSSCRRKAVSMYKVRRGATVTKKIDHSKVRNRLLEALTFYKEPLSTTKIYDETRTWRNFPLGKDTLLQQLHILRKDGYLVQLHRGNGIYWIAASNHSSLF